MRISERQIAITDVETSGLDSEIHEILEIGLMLVNRQTFEITDFLDVKVQPEHLETADEIALKVNGYNAVDWQNAQTLQTALSLYSEKTKDAIFYAYNVKFDWAFILEAFKKTGVKNLLSGYRVDLLRMARRKLRHSGLKKFKMDEVAKHFGISEEPKPHRAFTGTMIAYEIYMKLVL